MKKNSLPIINCNCLSSNNLATWPNSSKTQRKSNSSSLNLKKTRGTSFPWVFNAKTKLSSPWWAKTSDFTNNSTKRLWTAKIALLILSAKGRRMINFLEKSLEIRNSMILLSQGLNKFNYARFKLISNNMFFIFAIKLKKCIEGSILFFL